jgi:hypothetical protein
MCAILCGRFGLLRPGRWQREYSNIYERMAVVFVASKHSFWRLNIKGWDNLGLQTALPVIYMANRSKPC